jgi:hypothetical protein
MYDRPSPTGTGDLPSREDSLLPQPEGVAYRGPPAPRPPKIEAFESLVVVTGRQSYLATPWTIQESADTPALARQRELIRPVVTTFAARDRTVLELGVSSGFFALVALREGAAAATCVGPDPAHVELIRTVGDHLGIESLTSVHSDVETWKTPADIVFALDLLDRVGADSSNALLLKTEIGRLASLTRYLLIIEWVAPDPNTATRASGPDVNAEFHARGRMADELQAALRSHFVRVRCLGATTGSRALYVAYTTPFNVDGGNPMPLLEGKGAVIASRLQANVHSVDYWCRIYEDPVAGLVTKQATLDLAEREAGFLRRLRSDYFPEVVSSERGDGFSTVTMKRVAGTRLEEAAPWIRKDLLSMRRFALDCVNILEELEAAQVVHRDISVSNMLIRDGRPVLMDFAWSVSKGSPYETPWTAFSGYADHDGINVDTFMMGRLLKSVNDGAIPEMAVLADLMSNELPSLRLSDLGCIRSILELWIETPLESVPGGDQNGGADKTSVDGAGGHSVESLRTLYEMLVQSTRRSNLYEDRLNELSAGIRERDAAISELDRLRTALETDLQRRDELLSSVRDEVRVRDAAIAELFDVVRAHEVALACLRDELRQRDEALERAGHERHRLEAACAELEADVERLRPPTG